MIQLGRILDLSVSARAGAVYGTLLLWALFSSLGYLLLDLSLMQAILVGLAATLLFWVTNLVHHLGHAFAARRTGYPMSGVRFGYFLVLGASRYPVDEGELPANVHIRRALGGPLGSLLFSIVAGGIALMFRPANGILWWLALYVCLLSFFVFTLGSLIPLGFTDGSTLLRWWKRR